MTTIDISSHNSSRLMLYVVESGRKALSHSVVTRHHNVIQTETCDLVHPWIVAVAYEP